MKTILLPVDFTAYSAKAADFIANLFRKEPLHIVFLYTSSNKGKNTSDYTTEEAKELIDKEAKRIDHPNLTFKAVTSDVELIPIVERVAMEEKVDYIVLGTKGKTDLEACRNGSIAGYIIKRVSVPVITVPQHFELRSIREIVFATDLRDYHNNDIITEVVALAKKLDARIHLVNIHLSDLPLTMDDAKSALRLEHEFSDVAHLFHFYNDFSPIAGLEHFVDENNADLLITVSRHENEQQSIWYKSITKLAAEKIELPLLAFHD